jgi:periplasmic copper chaperone A
MNTKRIILSSSLALGLAGASATAADAHVTLQPKTAAAGTYTVEAVRVPNETDDAVTTKVAVQFPDGFAAASYQTTPGWSVKVVKQKLATPVKTDDGEITEGIDTITWTAKSKADAIPPGAFQDFGLSVKIPDDPGELTFKALQTYSGGDVVRWIGGKDSDTPAPIVTTSSGGGTEAAPAATPAPTQAVATPAPAEKEESSNDGLAIAALILGALGFIAGGAGLMAARRASGRSGVAA